MRRSPKRDDTFHGALEDALNTAKAGIAAVTGAAAKLNADPGAPMALGTFVTSGGDVKSAQGKALVTAFQTYANSISATGADGKPLTVDGAWGGNTQHALEAIVGPVTFKAAATASSAPMMAPSVQMPRSAPFMTKVREELAKVPVPVRAGGAFAVGAGVGWFFFLRK